MATVWTLFALVPLSQAQENNTANEVYLSFQYQGIVSTYVTTYYQDNQFYLPVGELFTQLQINHQVNQGSLSISGTYLGEEEYVLDFNNQVARIGDTEIQFQADDFLIKKIDYFLKPELFKQIFGLVFTTSFSNLTLDLNTENLMPVVAEYRREQKRQQIDRQEFLYEPEYYPLQYDRNYGTLDGAFLDYNLTGIYTNTSQLFTFNNALGVELLAGDVQGNIFGSLSDQQSSFTTSGLRWRYVQRDNAYFSHGIIGQTNTEGIANRSITGFRISNKPVEPRRLFDRYVIDGNVTPLSEVELYLNNRLIDYQEADQSGNYRFVVPLTYGTTNYSVRIFQPNGQSVERSRRIQVPFDYLPAGKVDYTLSGGRLSNPILGSTQRGYVGSASVSTGLADWLTAQLSSEYLSEYHNTMPSFTGTINARLFSNYLLSANVNTENFYRFTSNVVYAGGTSWSLSYDYNPGSRRLYNIGGNDQQARLNVFTPFQIGSVPLTARWSSSYQQNGNIDLLRYRADMSTRLGRLNVRLGYQDQQIDDFSLTTTTASRITNSYTYSMGRLYNIPDILKGVFIRGQLSYLPGLTQFEETEFQLSRDIFETGRIQLSFGHNFIGDFNTLSLNLTFDFNNIRSNTSSRITNTALSFTQSVRGSIGYDPQANQLLFNNRQQVGQSGAAVRLFVDNNNDGTYQDSTDRMIPEAAVRLNRAGGQTIVKNGINYVSQLLPYYRYDMEINQTALNNPLLVPDIKNFSIVTDPNQYKTIEIPFYLSGVISGKVIRKQDSTQQGLSGVRLYLESRYENKSRESFSEEIRTFSDGSFYTYEVPPGKYELYIDPNQLEFLNAISKPDTMDIEVESLADGDFIENLNFTVISKTDTTKQQIVAASDTSAAVPKNKDSKLSYRIQLASFHTRKKAEEVALNASQKLGGTFAVVKNTTNGMFAIRSLPLSDRVQAVETIKSYHSRSYKRTALVVIKDSKNLTFSRQTKFIQIGAFSSRERAERFAGNKARQLQKEIAVTHNKAQDLYKVYINKRLSSWQNQSVLLSSIDDRFPYEGAFINRYNHIQIGAFANQQRAETFAKESEILLDKRIKTSFDSASKHYNVIVDANYSSLKSRQAALDTIQNTSYDLYDAFVTTQNELNPQLRQITEREMHFTFQIQLGEDYGKDVLASILKQYPRVTLSRSDNNQLILDNIKDWSEVRQIQKQLGKLLTRSDPISILIETNGASSEN